MSAESVTIRSLSAENFRGFGTEHTVTLGTSVTIVSGPNGTGKTSLFDAFQWLFLGSISRLEKVTTRRSGDYVVNRFHGGSSARVSAELEVGSRSVQVVRAGNAKSSTLEFVDAEGTRIGIDAEAALRLALLGDEEIPLPDMLLNSGLLEQDVVRAVLEDEPRNRYRHMENLLGLQEVAGFEDETKRSADEAEKRAKALRGEHSASAAALKTREAELERLTQRLAGQPEIEAARNRLADALATKAPVIQIQELPTSSADAVALAQLARRMRSAAQELIEESQRLDRLETDLSSVDRAALPTIAARNTELGKTLTSVQGELEQARMQHRAAEQRSSQLAELAARALPLLGDRCPVCDQTINVETIEVHLQELISEGGADLPDLARTVRDAEARLDEVTTEVNAARTTRTELEASIAAADEAKEARARWRDACRSLASSVIVRADQQEAIAYGETAKLAELRAALDQLAGIADELAAVLGATGLGDEVERQRDRVERLREAEMELKVRAAAASREAEEAKTLASAATRAVAGVTTERFSTLQPLVEDIFKRLDPHPAFTTLGFELGVAYRSGIADPFVHDPESGVTADPLLVLSSSQANVAALAYFLALSWAAEPKALPFLLLDDPLQSMDDVNALGFADLCRHIRNRRQLVVSTHDHRLAGLLERKLVSRGADLGTRVLRFTGWTRGGPVVEAVEIQDEPLGFLIEAS